MITYLFVHFIEGDESYKGMNNASSIFETLNLNLYTFYCFVTLTVDLSVEDTEFLPDELVEVFGVFTFSARKISNIAI